ncbi:hypothetical protein E6P09_07145 [Haloferax mediterranei ATCC 33500]|uniref:Uncharacterized protein n=1 Tax=Haloferax mediterranei (strain ATCC 33500 / DSM 1411 / JCM 8866 / NBRC 14739 / NCIMB 2177 / R-4) TaxID=523841 RepID=I3R2T5_HALMT|nr:hypothetical protein [Haloferax mediterranei]AFK18545.1 hypothetical protein HFX_0823 [Haloferax mediterranei ATCC 33500]AHZ22077.1 hypothetical protein BM92_05120 [Haloferax mediterranei ATCC 33500]EMA02180.1 hypothetical protein C439_06355 [Haloferax mediterranei ATCC 33500]MDX5988636.1 hypothetical protein [Haloferax mediterranei ATCC 33500]QCQ75050.1 hypothetical protein E6P09_07145 [Haloferax mediterranei ATCC 33500]
MRTVRGPDGRRYLLVKRSSDASRVRDPKTGDERHFPNDELETVSGESPLETAARAVPEPVRRILVAVPTERSLGLLVDLADRGPLPVVELLGAYDLCESDLHGLLTEFKIAGLVEETTVYGERGYEVTDTAKEGIERLRANE